MYFLGHCQKILVSIPLFSASLTLAQGTTYETIYSLDSWSSQKPCAQQCFINTSLGCHIDEVAAAIGCEYNDCSANYGAPNDCYCRADLQSVAQSYLTSCVSAQCTVGDSSIDISSAGSIYNYYCSSNGFPAAAVVATTTLPATQATPTVASSSPPKTSSLVNNGDTGVSSPSTTGTFSNEFPSSSVDSGSATTVSASTPPSQGGGRGGLSTSDKIALGIGICFGIPSLVIGMAACVIAIRQLYAMKAGSEDKVRRTSMVT
ncbi:hypothetical protein NA56DRAFT_752581 [Hyaloscypha hepaticicola]|uniref:Extracellular membrane protein CFEM domain-containing protein n=1 Tax=Hyaloscypha hepaticicola TaxID=2082293 RepID=A0A2J6PT87_9HELO|nr:hypothetical protein NA56DRAFT_752581 [Hyaloscypha hepaticicola]